MEDENMKEQSDRKKRRGEIVRKTILIFLSAITVAGIIAGIYAMKIASRINRTPIEGVKEPIITENAIKKYGLITSSNSLGIADNYMETVIPDKKKNGVRNTMVIAKKMEDGVEKIDTIMIVTTDPVEKIIKVSTILPETLVFVPNKGEMVLRNAYKDGNPEITMFTINSNFNLNIDNFISFNVEDLYRLSDELDGIDIGISEAEEPLIGLKEGHHMMKSDLLRKYIEIRLPDEDYTGTLRKRKVFGSFLRELLKQNSSDITDMLEKNLPLINTTYSMTELLDLMFKTTMERYGLKDDFFPKEKEGRYTNPSKTVFVANMPLLKERVTDFIFGEDMMKRRPNDMNPLRELYDPREDIFQRN